jgi:hypothetical protein
MWREVEWRGQLELGKTAGEGGEVGRREEQREEGWRLKTRSDLRFPKNAGTPL